MKLKDLFSVLLILGIILLISIFSYAFGRGLSPFNYNTDINLFSGNSAPPTETGLPLPNLPYRSIELGVWIAAGALATTSILIICTPQTLTEELKQLSDLQSEA